VLRNGVDMEFWRAARDVEVIALVRREESKAELEGIKGVTAVLGLFGRLALQHNTRWERRWACGGKAWKRADGGVMGAGWGG